MAAIVRGVPCADLAIGDSYLSLRDGAYHALDTLRPCTSTITSSPKKSPARGRALCVEC